MVYHRMLKPAVRISDLINGKVTLTAMKHVPTSLASLFLNYCLSNQRVRASQTSMLYRLSKQHISLPSLYSSKSFISPTLASHSEAKFRVTGFESKLGFLLRKLRGQQRLVIG